MAKRTPANGLAYPGKRDIRRATRPNGRDTTAVGEHLVRKTYVLENSQVDRLRSLAKGQGVGINELMRWIMRQSLDAVEEGEWQLPLETVTLKRIME